MKQSDVQSTLSVQVKSLKADEERSGGGYNDVVAEASGVENLEAKTTIDKIVRHNGKTRQFRKRCLMAGED